ncbi:DUF3971 domain-containing protein [uncultured Maritimibacter sp.]|uniref:YhdP family protein n=1 Tax=uncultured Maritimibacter sp. TaxID=991866 RepID=UPI000A97C651|nr:DUF3971 domain-containing protein [uncultured Maritimibacter sp.]
MAEPPEGAEGQAGREAPDPPRATEGRRPRWRPRRLHVHLGVWSLLTIGIAALFLTLVSMSATGRAVPLPAWVAANVETRVNTLIPEGSITLRRIEIGVTPKGRPSLRLVDVGIRDASGLDVAQLNAIEGGVRLAPLFKGQLVPRTAILSGAQVTFRRMADGTFALQFGQGGTTTGNLAEVFDTIDAAFAKGILAEVDRVEAKGLTITLEDGRTGRLWQVTNGQMEMIPSEKIIETNIGFEVFNQTEELAQVEVALRSDRKTSAASLSVSFQNAAAADIGAQSPVLSFLSLVDAPISGALRTTLGPDGEITDLAGAMEIDEGGIKPNEGARTVRFGGAKGYVDYDPIEQAVNVRGLGLSSELGEAELEGKLYLTDYVKGWPQGVVAQLRLGRAVVRDPRVFDAPVEIERGYIDARVKLSPFKLDIGQAVFFHGDTRIEVEGDIGATRDAWDLSLEAAVPSLDVAELKRLWPKNVSPKPRLWVFENLTSGEIRDVRFAVRGPDLKQGEMLLGGRLTDAVVKPMRLLPEVRGASGYMMLADRQLTIRANAGRMTAPNGEQVDVSGSTFTVSDVRQKPGAGVADLSLAGPLQAGLSLLAMEPFNVFRDTDLGPDLAQGRFEAQGRVTFPMVKNLPFEQVAFDVRGKAFDLRSEKLVAGKILTSEEMTFQATPESVEVTGPGKLGDVAATAIWRQSLRPEDKGQGATVTGTVTLSQTAVKEFNLGLSPDMLGGSGTGDFALTLKPGQAPRVTLASDLAGLTLAIPGTGWSKGSGTRGTLDVAAVLGAQPKVERLSISAPGLDATGTLTTSAGGGLAEARFTRVQLGGWLDAPVTIAGQGRGVAISVEGGSADLRRANFGSGGSGGGGNGAQPLAIRLGQLTVAEGIVLSDFRGNFDLGGGLSGTFLANVAGGAPIEGTVAQTANGAAYRIKSGQGGEVLNGMGVFNKARRGNLEVVLVPTGAPGTFDGSISLTDTYLVDAPAMAELLSAISIVGLLEQMDGQGLPFSEVKGKFRLSPTTLTLYSSSAVSTSIGLSMDGYYNLDQRTLDMQGVLSPFYLINSIGRIVSARDGEGLVGFSFTLKGPASDMKVGVNPLSVLTPGFLREIFRRQAPQADGAATAPAQAANPQPANARTQ